ncbi:MAG: serine/threonine protein kinase [Myxococcales bacterium]|nr:serine/threonine protein kinase [Myxococcales bacterium]
MLTRGDILGGRFRLVDKVGEGGMGVVWLARDEKLQCDVALKLLHASLLDDEHSAARLRNEARAAAKVAHPGICRVLDVGEHESTPFLVMELLRGMSLSSMIERDQRARPELAVSITEAVLEALAAAHEEGVLHRDMKPENVFLCDDGTVKVLDFGVAKILDDAERVRLTRTGALIGTPAYMAPEQARGLPSDERADLWAVGVMLFEMLSGTLPFQAANYQGMLVAIATARPPSIRERCASLDDELAGIVDRALAPAVDDRWWDARRFGAALAQWRERRGISRATASVGSASAQRKTPRRSPREQAILTLTDPKSARSHKGLVVLGALALVLVVGATATRVARSSGANTPDTDAGAPRTPDARDAAVAVVSDAGVPRDVPDAGAAEVTVAPVLSRTSDAAVVIADGAAADGARVVRRVRGRRPDGGASAGIGRDPDF